MSNNQKRYFVYLPSFLIGSLVFLGVFFLSSFKGTSAHSVPAREVILTAKNVVFKDADMMETNPKLYAKVGETIRIVFKNTDPGIVHALSVPEINAKNLEVRPGKEVVLEITPKVPGSFEYVCPLHATIMKGKIIVE